jgi:hypothetical protein
MWYYENYCLLGCNAVVLCGGGFEYLHRSPASRRRRRKGKPSAWGYNWVTLFLGDVNMGT